jgi:hypothetical protein
MPGLFVFLIAIPLFAQSPTAVLVGSITDSSGGALAGANVAARELDTGLEHSVLTNASGAYRIAGLQAGPHALTVSAAQFSTHRQTCIVLRVGDELRFDIALRPGAIEQTVEVTASLANTATESAAMATVIDTRNIQELPLNGRQLQNLALLAPGIAAGWNWSTAANRYGKARENTEGAFVVNGMRGRSNNFLLDGMPMNVRQYGVIDFEPSNEAVREFELKSSSPQAEFGGTMGATVNIVTRMGTNRLRGSLYEFFRNDVLDANNTFSTAAGLPRGKLRQNQYGGSLGGRLFSDRHFFFGNFEQLRILEGVETRLVSVPSPDERNGLIRFRDTSGAQQTLNLASRINPISRRLLEFYPQPNASGGGSTGNALNYNAALAIGLVDTQFHIRTDHYLTSRDTVTVRVSRNNNDQNYIVNRFGGPYIPGFSLPNPEVSLHGTIGYLHSFSAPLVNEFRIGVNRYANNLANGDRTTPSSIGIPNGNEIANGMPSIAFAGGAIEPLGGLSWFNREQNELTTMLSDSLSYLAGRHSFKFGGDFTALEFNTRGASNQRGSIAFDGSRNGLIPRLAGNERAGALADFLLGQPYEASIVVGQFGRGYRQTAFALFAQDSWRATSKLTVNLGVRYDYSSPWNEVNGKLSNLRNGALGVVGSEGFYRPDRNNFAPRLGFAYDVSGSGTTVLRAGFAILYETLLQANSVQQVENNPPYSASAVTRTPTPFPSSGLATTLLDLRSQAQSSRAIAAVDYNDFRNPFGMQYNFGVQRRIGGGWLLDLAYVGSRGLHLPFFFNANQAPLRTLTASQRALLTQAVAAGQDTTPILNGLRPYPGFDSVTLSRNAASSTYHSGQIKIERRFARGLSLLASYTFSKSIDNASDFGSGDASERVLDSTNLASQRAVSSFDVPHRLASAFTYEIPGARAARILTAGWQVNAIVTLQSGQPFTPSSSVFDPYRNEAFNRPDVLGDPRANVPAGLAFNPAAFRIAALGTFGNAGRNIVRGDGFHSADLSLFKNFKVTEQARLQFRAEAVNGFNHVNYQGPVMNLNTTPGRFVSAAPPRIVQLGLKLSF